MTREHAEREETIVASDGYQIGATVFTPVHAAPKGVCMINSALGVPQAFYKPIASWLASCGYVVITYDYRGLFKSLKGHPFDCSATASDWGQLDTEAIINFAIVRYPSVELILVAQSMGGHVFSLAPSAHRISKVVTITSQSGFFGHWPIRRWPIRLLRYFILMPFYGWMTGFMPVRSYLGVDLPKRVGTEWASWCRNPRYVTAKKFGFRDQFSAIEAPMVCVGFDDDPIAPRKAVRAFSNFFPNSSKDLIFLNPADLGMSEIGHFGFFRRRNKHLWPMLLNWISARDDASTIADRTTKTSARIRAAS